MPIRGLRGTGADLLVVGLGLLYVAAAFVVGAVLTDAGRPISAPMPPLLAWWRPHLVPATPLALAIAVAVVAYGPRLAEWLSWGKLLSLAWLTSCAWVMALVLVETEGWAEFTERLTTRGEYLYNVPDAPGWSRLLPGFTDRIAPGPDAYTTHVAGHPPGAFGFFVLLDRIGLAGGTWAALVCVGIGTSAVVAVAVTLRAVDSERMARRAVPFLMVVPAAIWIGVSADAMFLGVSAWAVALLAVAVGRDGWSSYVAAVGSGLLFGATIYLSYGLLLVGAVAAAVLLASLRERAGPAVRSAIVILAVIGVVVVLVTVGGFVWWEAYDQLLIRYYAGVGGVRPYGYWVWANVGALLVCTGPVVVAGVRRAVLSWRTSGVAAVGLGAVVAVSAATLSGLSKAEVERIWLPFAIWLVAACALLPARRHRSWLGVQAAAALVVQHLLALNW